MGRSIAGVMNDDEWTNPADEMGLICHQIDTVHLTCPFVHVTPHKRSLPASTFPHPAKPSKSWAPTLGRTSPLFCSSCRQEIQLVTKALRGDVMFRHSGHKLTGIRPGLGSSFRHGANLR